MVFCRFSTFLYLVWKLTNWTYFPKWVRWLTNVFDVNFQKLRNLSKLRKSELPEGSDNRGMQKCSVLSLEGGKCKWCFWMIPFRSSYPEPFHPNSTEGFLWHHAAPHIAMQALMLHGISANTHTHSYITSETQIQLQRKLEIHTYKCQWKISWRT